MSAPEERLAKLFGDEGIAYEREKPLWSHRTGRYRRVDFYLPAVDLYVEAKGPLTFDAIRKIDELARPNRNYYLYSASDYEWRPYASDWPEVALARAAAGRLDRYRQRIWRHWVRRSRETKGYRYKKQELLSAVALQHKELARLAKNTEMARHASAVTLARLKRYADMMADEFLIVGLLSEDKWRKR